jgi:uncharacterized oligopeptide transporter (OPT) family protein
MSHLLNSTVDLPLATGVPIMSLPSPPIAPFVLVLLTSLRIGAMISGLTEGSHANEASTGVLFAGGLITGEALMGIILAIPIAISGNTSVLHLLSEVSLPPSPSPSMPLVTRCHSQPGTSVSC